MGASTCEGGCALVVGEREVPKGGFVALVFGEWRSLQDHPSPDYAFAPDDEEAVAPVWPVDVRRYPWAAANERGSDRE